jgi:hypothetical protein
VLYDDIPKVEIPDVASILTNLATAPMEIMERDGYETSHVIIDATMTLMELQRETQAALGIILAKSSPENRRKILAYWEARKSFFHNETEEIANRGLELLQNEFGEYLSSPDEDA